MTDSTQTREELEAMDEDGLRAIAQSRGVTVTASDGSDSPSVDDYVEALAPPDAPFGGEPSSDPDVRAGDEAARSAQQAARKPSKRIDETVPGGSYLDPRGNRVNAAGERLGGDGKVIPPEDLAPPGTE